MALIDDIVAYYKADASNSNDSTPNAYHGSDYASLAYATGKIGNGFNHGSGAGYVNMPSGVYGRCNGNLNFTINVWMKSTSLTSSNDQPALYCQSSSIGGFYKNQMLFAISPSGYIDFRRGDGSNIDQLNGTINMVVGTWYMVSITYDGSNMRGYVNAALDGSPLASTRSQVSGGGAMIGGAMDSRGSNLFNTWYGLIDEVGIWSRALSGAEITSLYNAGAGLQYPFSVGGGQNSAFLQFMR